MPTEYTTNYQLAKPDFNLFGWHDEVNGDFDTIDSILFALTGLSNFVGSWTNSTNYIEGQRVIDPDDASIWNCAVTHTSAATDTMADDRAANPTYWSSVTSLPFDRGEWDNGITYSAGDIAHSTPEGLFGIANALHTSSAFPLTMRDDIANWTILFDAAVIEREWLTEDRTYYVRTDGSDSNTGQVDNAGGAWLTLQHAWDWCQDNLDLAGYAVYIYVADGTYSSASHLLIADGLFAGQTTSGSVRFVGNTTTPANCVLNGDIWTVAGRFGAQFRISGFKLTGGVGIQSTQHAWIDYSQIDFGVCTTHVAASKYGTTFDDGDITISGDADVHSLTSDTGQNYETTGTTTLTGTPAFGIYAFALVGGIFGVHTKTYTGAATGKRFEAIYGSQVGLPTLTTLPGDVAGTIDDSSVAFISDFGIPDRAINPWIAFTPSVSAAGGSVTTGTCTGRYKDLPGKTRIVSMVLPITANTATFWFNVTLPSGNTVGAVVGSASWGLGGAGVGGLACLVSASTNVANITKYDGTVPTGTGTVYVTVTYEIA